MANLGDIVKIAFTLAVSAIGCLILAGCETTEYSMAPSVGAAEGVTYERGIATVASDGPNSSVKVTPIGFTAKGRIRIVVAVLNKSPTPSNLGYDNVEITDNDGFILHKLDRDELVRIVRRQAAIAGVAVALGGAAQAYSNSYAAQSTTYGTFGNTSFTATTYNPALANALNERTNAQTISALSNIDAGLNNAINSFNGSILQTTTVRLGQIFGGEMIVDRPPAPKNPNVPQKITVVVNFAGDQHVFNFDLAAHTR